MEISTDESACKGPGGDFLRTKWKDYSRLSKLHP